MKYSVTLSVVLFGVWLSWSGHFSLFFLTVGALSCLAVGLTVSRMRLTDAEGVPIALGFRPLLYLPWLAWEIVKGNLAVARVILDPRLPIQPAVVRVRSSQKTDLGRVLLANSITLTPGTVSIELARGEITVHALTLAAQRDVLDGKMDRRCTALEGGS